MLALVAVAVVAATAWDRTAQCLLRLACAAAGRQDLFAAGCLLLY